MHLAHQNTHVAPATQSTFFGNYRSIQSLSDDSNVVYIKELNRRAQFDVDTAPVLSGSRRQALADSECDELPPLRVPGPLISFLWVQSVPVRVAAAVEFANESRDRVV